METLEYGHVSADVSTVHLALFSDVENAAELRRRLVSAATVPGEEGEHEREAVNYAFVDAKLVRVLPTYVAHINSIIFPDNKQTAYPNSSVSGDFGLHGKISSYKDVTFRSSLGIESRAQCEAS